MSQQPDKGGTTGGAGGACASPLFNMVGHCPTIILGQVRRMLTSGKAESARFKLADGEEADVA